MRDLAELNIIDGRVTGARRPARSNEVINAFQSHYGITLPEAYLTLLRHSNGGFPELDTIVPVGTPSSMNAPSDWGVNRFCHLDDNRTSGYGLWAVIEAWRPILGCEALPIAEDHGGNQLFIDLKKPAAPIKVCVHDDN